VVSWPHAGLEGPRDDDDATRLAVCSNPHKENRDNADQNFPDSRKENQEEPLRLPSSERLRESSQ
jgi:hypothetical protein